MPKSRLGCTATFIVAMLLALIIPSFMATIKINFFVPPLVIAFYFVSLPTAAWLSLLFGLILDGVQLLPRFGFLGSSYLITCLILYQWRLYFFKDAFSTVPIMTYLFSFICTLVQALSAHLFDLPSFSLTIHWFVSDVLIMPLLDAAYALSVFSLPHFVYRQYYKTKNRYKNRHAH
ncbi:MAG: mreD [Chlamydiia bacterium]|nr:mreD [Chlamydiia bacterium]